MVTKMRMRWKQKFKKLWISNDRRRKKPNQTLHQHIVRYFSYFCTTSKKINEHCSASVKLPFIPNELKIKKNKIDRKIVTPFRQFTVQSTTNIHKYFFLVNQTDFREVNSMALKSIWRKKNTSIFLYNIEDI